MNRYKKSNPELWTGRKSGNQLYLHEKVKCVDFEIINLEENKNSFALLGYACDEGVKRNHGRVGAAMGPDAIRQVLGKQANHTSRSINILDFGNVVCQDGDMEATQQKLSQVVTELLQNKMFPILLGGGHDIAYGHYLGIRNYLNDKNKHTSIGIINIDAHFDLRTVIDKGNSGTPFYQIAKESYKDNFHYICLGVQKQSNTTELFETAYTHSVDYVLSRDFNSDNKTTIFKKVETFIQKTDYVYLTIDLDGFSSAYAPGVSAPSPFGFEPNFVCDVVRTICKSEKLISVDVAELNPRYDIDNSTAKLAAGLVHLVIESISEKPVNQ